MPIDKRAISQALHVPPLPHETRPPACRCDLFHNISNISGALDRPLDATRVVALDYTCEVEGFASLKPFPTISLSTWNVPNWVCFRTSLVVLIGIGTTVLGTK